MLTKRLANELKKVKTDCPENISAGPSDSNLFQWNGMILGPIKTPYEGGLFRLTILFPVDYPYKPPKVTFITKIYHPNINQSGQICLDILKDQWSPSLTISNVLLSICSLLNDPNPNDPLMPDIANLFLSNKSKYEEIAKQWTLLYASH